jgi:hypothetical protein
MIPHYLSPLGFYFHLLSTLLLSDKQALCSIVPRRFSQKLSVIFFPKLPNSSSGFKSSSQIGAARSRSFPPLYKPVMCRRSSCHHSLQGVFPDVPVFLGRASSPAVVAHAFGIPSPPLFPTWISTKPFPSPFHRHRKYRLKSHPHSLPRHLSNTEFHGVFSPETTFAAPQLESNKNPAPASEYNVPQSRRGVQINLPGSFSGSKFRPY